MTITVVRYAEGVVNGQNCWCHCHIWTFWFDADDLALVLDDFKHQTRASARHEFKTAEEYKRQPCHSVQALGILCVLPETRTTSDVSIKVLELEDVPMPDGVLHEAKESLVRQIAVCRTLKEARDSFAARANDRLRRPSDI